MLIKKLEDLEVWKKSLTLCKLVYRLTSKFPKSEQFNITHHLRECVRNVPGNLAEGFGRYHYQESIQFYRIARGSLNEVKSDSYLSHALNYILESELSEVLKLVDEILRMLNGLILSTKYVKSPKIPIT